MLSQFSPENGKSCLADLLFNFPKDVYPVGRLDEDSEGLLLITNDKKINHKLLNPDFAHRRTYWVQVEGEITDEALQTLSGGVEISINGKHYFTLPAIAERLLVPPDLPERNPPVRFRKSIPTSWLSLTLVEGKNRQVRKMTAKTGYPTLRLVRVAIENITINNMKVGQVKMLSGSEIYDLLNIK